MPLQKVSNEVGLEAKDPFELRVNLGVDISESTAKTALKTGDMGFLHSFTTGSTVDGPGGRVVAWTAGCQFRCSYCHNPDTWHMMNGMPVTLERAREPLMQARSAVRLFAAAKSMGIHTALDTTGYLGERLSDKELEQIDVVLLDI